MSSDVNLTSAQQDCLDHLREWKVGAVFMDMGTGKTRVAAEIINAITPSDVLWIGPLRTLPSAKEEISKWRGTDDIRFIGVESIGQSERKYLDIYEWAKARTNLLIIVDESLKIKNFYTKRTMRVLELGSLADYRFILNGTPITKNILDLWAQMEFLSPAILNMSYQQYLNTFCRYRMFIRGRRNELQVLDFVNLDYLYSLIRRYIYRNDLFLRVARNYQVERYRISEESLSKYNQIKRHYLDMETLDKFNNNIFFSMTTALQMTYCCDEAKFKIVDRLLSEIPKGKVIIFCRFIKSREECMRKYPDVLVLSYQKESFGLNLQDYCHIIYFDKVWDLALRMQSERRIYRLGQRHNCHYYDLTGNIGLESLMDSNISRKIKITEYFKSKSKKEIIEEL